MPLFHLYTSENLEISLPLSFLSLSLPSSLSVLLPSWLTKRKKSPPARGATLACLKAITSLAISYPQLNILPTDIARLPSPASST